MAGPPEDVDFDAMLRQAKALKRGVTNGDAEALRRVFAHHPHLAGRDPDRLDPARFNLLDAQATVAREVGFDSWADVVGSVTEATGVRRWKRRYPGGPVPRSWAVTRRLHHRSLDGPHILIALCESSGPAAQALADVGVTVEGLEALVAGARKADDGEVYGSPVASDVFARAEGISIGMGADRVSDEHVLLALLHDPTYSGQALLIALDVDPEEVWEALGARGADMPAVRLQAPHGPMTPPAYVVYFPMEALADVKAAVGRVPGIRFKGESKRQPGKCYLYAPDTHPVADMVRAAVPNPDDVEVHTMKEAEDDPDLGMH